MVLPLYYQTTEKTNAMKMYQRRSLALRIAHQVKILKGCSFGEAQRIAWAHLNDGQAHSAALVTFQKVSGETCSRVVYLGNFTDYVEIKGTGTSPRPARRAFVDLAKVAAGVKHPVISVYLDRIQSLVSYN